MVLSCPPHRINGPRKERGPWQEDDGRKVQCTYARTNDSPILGGAGTLRPWKPKRASCACSATYASVMHGTLQSRLRKGHCGSTWTRPTTTSRLQWSLRRWGRLQHHSLSSLNAGGNSSESTRKLQPVQR